MADGKIEIEIELDDSGVKKQSQTAGKQAGSSFKSGFEGSSKGSTDKTEEEIKSAGKSAGTSGKSAGKKFKDGFESATKGTKAPDVDTSKIASAGKTAGTAFGAAFAAAAAAVMAAIGVANEYQEDMGKLTVSAQANNVGIDQANASYREMVGILGEVDQSVEAVNHLFTLTQGNTEQLSDWTTIASGVYASFGDSLPLEGLTEAANESSRVGW